MIKPLSFDLVDFRTPVEKIECPVREILSAIRCLRIAVSALRV